ncbi:glycine betaine ABC transporter glycine betaine-binding protein [Holzapfeliella floricola DSM 23037 = JCM 16512]|uniref:Glycine betaine ABC transporter glycine betaine-binding protein n=2 Tax=Holzapfeliella TaxID=2767883 RepID=A0A0R2DKU1_9LACO|nr:glycine betaine ABC transporter glycine betaine-binding protein [Holzapfeliella floricola DSM 23037 = JCM 16512]
MLSLLLVGLSITACSSKKTSQVQDTQPSSNKIRLAYKEWDDAISSTFVVGEVLQDMGYQVEMVPLDNIFMWKSVADGSADAMVTAWLPTTNGPEYKRYKNNVDIIGESLVDGAKAGFIVPSYMSVNSIADLKNEANKTITGMEPGAGITANAEKTLKRYPNLKGFKLMPSSSGAMFSALDKAIKNKEEIIITGWMPHWSFNKYDIKVLDDPQGTISAPETITTIARKGLKEDKPEAFKVLQNFKWDLPDINEIMVKLSDNVDPKKAAREWIEKNPEKVASWKQS